MRVVIISGGAIRNYEYIKKQIKENDTVICADSGYNHAVKMGVKIEMVVGDFDSAGQVPNDIKTVRYQAEKDQTDTEIAVEHAREMGFRNFLIIAGTGSRMDHTLTNILMLKDFLERNEQAELIDEHNKIRITNSRITLREKKGTIVSLLPLCDCFGVTTENLIYPLCKANMQMGKGLGVSNIMAEENAQVTIDKGILLVITARD